MCTLTLKLQIGGLGSDLMGHLWVHFWTQVNCCLCKERQEHWLSFHAGQHLMGTDSPLRKANVMTSTFCPVLFSLLQTQGSGV